MRTQDSPVAERFRPGLKLKTNETLRAQPAVLLVEPDGTSRNTVKAMLRNAPYRLLECHHATAAMEILIGDQVDLVIVAKDLPGISGLEFCRWIKANSDTQLIPVLVLTTSRGVNHEIEAIDSGADEFLAKPVHAELLRARVSAMLRNKSMTDSLEKAEAILFTLAQAVEQRDRFTGEHCHRLAVYGVALGKAMGVSATDRLAIYRGGYLHDIGKIAIPDSVLFKPGALNSKEWEIMRLHPMKGEEICRPMKSLADVLPIIRYHHERWDGKGYPDGLRGDEIPLNARILQVCDIYDALTSARCYKPAMTHEEAVEILREEVRRGWRDPRVVSAFLKIAHQSLPGIMIPAMNDLSGMLSMHHSIADSCLGLAG